MKLHNIMRNCTMLCAAASLAGASPLRSEPKPETPVRLDAAVRARIVETVAAHMDSKYVFAEPGREIAQSLRRRCQAGEYDAVDDGAALAERLTRDMQAVTPDRHLKVLFSPEPRPMRDEAGAPSDQERAQRRLDAVRVNFGIERAEHLDGNVGYLKLTRFEDPALAGETIAAAMRFLSGTDALVVDLRFNGGGNSGMVALLTSYFFDEPIHLVDFFDRPSGETSQSWTLPFVPGPRYTGKPVFVLTGQRTFSAAEQFVYHLQKSQRATVVGQPTRGGAHFVKILQIDPHFAVMVPVGDVTSPLTGSNWEGTGITPDVAAESETAVRTAHRLAVEKLLASAEGRHAEYLRMLAGEMKSESAQ